MNTAFFKYKAWTISHEFCRLFFQSIFISTCNCECGFSLKLWNFVGKLMVYNNFPVSAYKVVTGRQIQSTTRPLNAFSCPIQTLGYFWSKYQCTRTKKSGGAPSCWKGCLVHTLEVSETHGAEEAFSKSLLSHLRSRWSKAQLHLFSIGHTKPYQRVPCLARGKFHLDVLNLIPDSFCSWQIPMDKIHTHQRSQFVREFQIKSDLRSTISCKSNPNSAYLNHWLIDAFVTFMGKPLFLVS